MKQKLVESYYKDWSDTEITTPTKISLNEKNNSLLLKETRYPILCAYKIPIWKLDQKNFNGRVYPKSLGEKVVKENKITIVLDTHPEDNYEPKIKDIIAVGKNPSVENTNIGPVLFAECYFIDKAIAEKVERAVDHGYMFEQSSSGYGELNERNEVITETYELERYFDILVSDSSYNVFLGKENEITQEVESKNKIESVKENIATNLIEDKEIKDTNEENTMSENKLSFEDKMIRRSIKKSIKEALEVQDLKERLKEFKEIHTYFEDVTDKESFKELLVEVQNNIETINSEIEDLAEKGKQFDSVVKEKEEIHASVEELNEKIKQLEESLKEKEEQAKEFEEKLDAAFEEMDKSKEVYQNLKTLFEDKVAEANTLVDPDDYIKLYNENKELEERNSKLEKRIDLFVESIEESKKEKIEEAEDKKKDDKEEKEKEDDKESDDKSEEVEDKKDKEDDSEEKEKEDDKEKDKKKEESFTPRKRHDSLRIETQLEEVANYYEDLRKVYGEAIEQFKEDFENCTTLVDAQHCFFRHKPFLSESLSLRASDRRHVIDRFKEDTITSKEKEIGNRTNISLNNCKPDPTWI